MRKFTGLAMAFIATMTIGTKVLAQKQCNLGISVTPSITTVNYHDTLFFSYTITNNGPTAMTPTDTMYLGAVGGGNVFSFRFTANVAAGGSQTFNKAIYIYHNIDTFTADRTYNFCYKIYPQSSITIDPDGTGPQPSRPAVVTYTDPVSNNDSSCANNITFKKKPTVGIFELSGNSKEPLTIYPNPATNNVSFDLNFTRAEKVQVSVKDIAGREVLRKDFGKVQAGNTTPFVLDISKLQAGMYIVEMNGEERRAVGRFTKR